MPYLVSMGKKRSKLCLEPKIYPVITIDFRPLESTVGVAVIDVHFLTLLRIFNQVYIVTKKENMFACILSNFVNRMEVDGL